MIELIKVFILGVIEGITEWLPISSTGHLILTDEFLKLAQSAAFIETFRIVIQLGAIMAVVVLYFHKLNPWSPSKSTDQRRLTWSLWAKIAVASVPAAIIGLLFDDQIDALFFNSITVVLMLIIYGIGFLIIEQRQAQLSQAIELDQISWRQALMIGGFQTLALIPGTSRSGATVLGGLMLGIKRQAIAEFSFFLAIPVMFGASFLKLLKVGFNFTGLEWALLGFGSLVAFVVSILAIKFLLNYIKKNDFKPFGWYRIILGFAILIYFFWK